MAEDRVPPNNITAEESLLGAMLLSQDSIRQAVDLVGPNDFYLPSHGAIFDVITRLWRQGQPNDPITVAELLRREGSLDWVGGQQELVRLQTQCPSTSSSAYHARIIVDHALLRRLILIGTSVVEGAYLLKEPDELLDVLKADVASIDMPSIGLPKSLISVDEFLKLDLAEMWNWVIPGLLAELWRMMIVAEEGAGKTLLSQMLALTVARGIHPFTLEPIAPKTTLMVDLENPDGRILEGFKMIDEGMNTKDFPVDQAWLWREPGGISLRTRADRAQFERVLAHLHPALVCICPLYKSYQHTARESDEVAAREVMAVLDDLRTRYNFALVLEHHAPKEQNGFRKLNPYGTVLWQRWCELGRSIVRDKDQPMGTLDDEPVNFSLTKFRFDRVHTEWPRGIYKSPSGLPWAARWDTYVPAPSWRQLIDDDHDPF